MRRVGGLSVGYFPTVRAAIGLSVLALFSLAAVAAAQPTAASIARLGLRITNDPGSSPVEGSLYAVDSGGRAVTDLSADVLQAHLDGRPIQLSLSGVRPSIALAAAFWLDSSATPQVRDAAANALVEAIQSVDVNRDTVAIVNTTQTTPWDQARFSNSATQRCSIGVSGLLSSSGSRARCGRRVVSMNSASRVCCHEPRLRSCSLPVTAMVRSAF